MLFLYKSASPTCLNGSFYYFNSHISEEEETQIWAREQGSYTYGSQSQPLSQVEVLSWDFSNLAEIDLRRIQPQILRHVLRGRHDEGVMLVASPSVAKRRIQLIQVQ
jgi:hypothetical protein